MLRIALIVALVGLFCLSLLFLRAPVPYAADLPDKTLVWLEGVVESERTYSSYMQLSVGGVALECDCPRTTYLGKRVRAEGLLEHYNGRARMRVLDLYLS